VSLAQVTLGERVSLDDVCVQRRIPVTFRHACRGFGCLLPLARLAGFFHGLGLHSCQLEALERLLLFIDGGPVNLALLGGSVWDGSFLRRGLGGFLGRGPGFAWRHGGLAQKRGKCAVLL
jgi:hypothetical protein